MTTSNLKPFQPGQSGNPAGRPKGSRHRVSEAFVAALADDFELHGKATIERVRQDKPDQYLKVIASILPKDINLKTDPLESISDERLDQLIAMLEQQIAEQDALALGDGMEEAMH